MDSISSTIRYLAVSCGSHSHYLSLTKLTNDNRLHSEIDGTIFEESLIHISANTVQYLECIVKAFARRAITMALHVRELDFVLKRHTKSWRLGRHPHVC